LNLPELSRNEVAYLEAMYRLEESHGAASVSALARKFNVRLPTAIEILDKLERKGLVVRKPWKVPELSKRGMVMAESIMHQHRVLELYFNTKLGLESQLSCDEASRINYLLDSPAIEKMCKSLNRPSQCLHGNTIRHKGH